MPPKLKPTPAYSSHVEIYTEAESAALTPRTPFSQSARAEEGLQTPRRAIGQTRGDQALHQDESDDQLDEIDLLQTQSHPLLHSSTSGSFPPRNLRGKGARTNGSSWKKLRERGFWRSIRKEAARRPLPFGLLLGCGGAILLLILLAFSLKKQDALLDYIGVNTTAIAYESLDDESKARYNSSTVINLKAAGYTSFPLTTSEYIKECWKVTHDPRMKFAAPSYWTPRPGVELDVLHQKSTKTCSSTITYILDGSVGLFADLALLAQTAAFARERNRTFFVYDEPWNRGKWSDHFLPISETQPGPEPGCMPPPPEELVACPRTARHWVTSTRIMFFHLGEPFMDDYEDAYKHTIERSKPMFDHALESFTNTIIPSLENQRLIKKVRDEVARIATNDLNMTSPSYIATHIRRGDRKALSWRYQKTETQQVPIEEYASAFWGTYSRLQNLSDSGKTPSNVPFVYLASDSPQAATNFTDLVIYNDTLARKYNNNSLYGIVYGLQTSDDYEIQQLASSKAYVQSEWNETREQKDRIRETRGVIVDWALMSGFWQPTSNEDGNQEVDQVRPEATVCVITSNMCTLALLGLGWENGFDWTAGDVGHHPNWVEIDNKGNIDPMWRAFETFS